MLNHSVYVNRAEEGAGSEYDNCEAVSLGKHPEPLQNVYIILLSGFRAEIIKIRYMTKISDLISLTNILTDDLTQKSRDICD